MRIIHSDTPKGIREINAAETKQNMKVQEADSLSSKVFLNILNPTSHSRYYISVSS